jgi:hypothetical protein
VEPPIQGHHHQSQTGKCVLNALQEYEEQNEADECLLSDIVHAMVQETEQEEGNLPNALPNAFEEAYLPTIPLPQHSTREADFLGWLQGLSNIHPRCRDLGTT